MGTGDIVLGHMRLTGSHTNKNFCCMAVITGYYTNLTGPLKLIYAWPVGPKSYLQQPVIASSIIQQTKMEEPQAAVSALLGLISVACSDGDCWMTGFIDLVRMTSLSSD